MTEGLVLALVAVVSLASRSGWIRIVLTVWCVGSILSHLNLGPEMRATIMSRRADSSDLPTVPGLAFSEFGSGVVATYERSRVPLRGAIAPLIVLAVLAVEPSLRMFVAKARRRHNATAVDPTGVSGPGT